MSSQYLNTIWCLAPSAEYTFRLLFGERSISIMAYNLETILAEKLETVLSRNIANTRPRDFYDVYILYALRGSEYNPKILKAALEETAKKRGSLSVLGRYESIVANIRNNSGMKNFWSNYQKELIMPRISVLKRLVMWYFSF